MKLQSVAISLCMASAGVFASPTYQSFDVPGSYATEAWGINNQGDVVGYYGVSGTGNLGFIYDPATNQYTSLSGLAGWSDVQAYAINDNGTVGGSYRDSSNVTHGFLYSNGSYSTIDAANNQYGTVIWGIDDSGQLALTYSTSLFNSAYLWTPDGHGGYTTKSLSVAADGTFAGALDKYGDMVGYYQNPGYGGFEWNSNGNVSTFNVPNDAGTTQALGINDNGVIVGDYFSNHITGFIYQNGTFTTNINPPGSTYTYITGINDSGTVEGWYMDSGDHTHSFIATGLLSPGPTPEPSSLVTAFTGLALVAIGYRRRRKQS